MGAGYFWLGILGLGMGRCVGRKVGCTMMRCVLMNSRDFILDEQRDVVRVMQELVGGLSEKNIIKPKHNNISTTQRGVLRQKPVSTKVSFPQERYCGIVADGWVQIVVEKNNSERGVVWEKVMKQDVSSSLRGRNILFHNFLQYHSPL